MRWALPIDYKSEDVPERVREIYPSGVDVVFDNVGDPGLMDSWRMLRRGGALVSYGSSSTVNSTGHRLTPLVNIFARVLFWNAVPNGKRASFYYVQRWPRLFGEDLAFVLSLCSSKVRSRRTSRDGCCWRRPQRRLGF